MRRRKKKYWRHVFQAVLLFLLHPFSAGASKKVLFPARWPARQGEEAEGAAAECWDNRELWQIEETKYFALFTN